VTEEVTSQNKLFSILTSVRFPDLKQTVMLQSLAYMLCGLLLRNLYSAIIPDFRKFFIDEM